MVKNIDSLVVEVCDQDVTPAVCGDVEWIKRFLGGRRRTGVSKAEFAGRADHHYCSDPTINHADIPVYVLTDIFVMARCIERVTLVIPLYGLFLCGARIAHDS